MLKIFDTISFELSYPSNLIEPFISKINILQIDDKIRFRLYISVLPSTTLIKDRSFHDSTIKQITISSSVTKIGNGFFGSCILLENIIIPSSVKLIGNDAFCGCHSLAQISIPDSVTVIENGSFCDCHSLKQISIPSSVTRIGCNTFLGCTSLEQISIPDSFTSIGIYAFSNCVSFAIGKQSLFIKQIF